MQSAAAAQPSADITSAEAIRFWLQSVLQRTGLKPTPLAKAAGLAPSTLLRALDPEKPGSLERRSIDKIVQKFGVPPPMMYASNDRPTGVLREEVAIYTAADDDTLTTTQGRWTIHTRALELAGYMAGDIITADSAVQPRPRDVVVAQQIDPAGNAETIIRLYDPPYLLTETADPSARRKPLYVDGERVQIWGVVVKSVRVRR